MESTKLLTANVVFVIVLTVVVLFNGRSPMRAPRRMVRSDEEMKIMVTARMEDDSTRQSGNRFCFRL